MLILNYTEYILLCRNRNLNKQMNAELKRFGRSNFNLNSVKKIFHFSQIIIYLTKIVNSYRDKRKLYVGDIGCFYEQTAFVNVSIHIIWWILDVLC